MARFCPGCGLELGGTAQRGVHEQPTPSPSSQAGSPATVAYAGFWRRVAAFLIDRLLLSFVNAALCLSYFFLSGMDWRGEELQTLTLTSAVFGFLLKWLYCTVLESSSFQATLGKALIGIRVTDEQGRRISLLKANARYWAKILSTLTFGFGYLMAGFTRRKQALHDLVAGTLVVRS
ncbi:MAG: RDD family protein [Deltaproteobacteria bacterium]|nr:RDD family protein [Deltaproteobacteria bacterium]